MYSIFGKKKTSLPECYYYIVASVLFSSSWMPVPNKGTYSNFTLSIQNCSTIHSIPFLERNHIDSFIHSFHPSKPQPTIPPASPPRTWYSQQTHTHGINLERKIQSNVAKSNFIFHHSKSRFSMVFQPFSPVRRYSPQRAGLV